MTTASWRRPCTRAATSGSACATARPRQIGALTERCIKALSIPGRASATLICLTSGMAAARRTTSSTKSGDAPPATYAAIGIDVACDRVRTILQTEGKIASRIDGGTLRLCVGRQVYCETIARTQISLVTIQVAPVLNFLESRSCPRQCESHRLICSHGVASPRKPEPRLV